MSVLNLTLKSLSILRGNAATFAGLTAPIFALYAVIQAVAAYQLTGLTPNLIGQANTPHLTTSGIVTMYAAMLISLIVSALIAIRVHRYVLKEDTSFAHAAAPSIYGNYLLQGLVLGLALIGMMIVVMLPLGIAFGIMGAASDGDGAGTPPLLVWALIIAIGVVVMVLFLRMALVLPAAAIGEKMPLRGSFRASRGQSAAIFVALLANWMSAAALGQIVGHVLPFPLLGWLAQMLVAWPFMVWGAVTLTTLYGHCVEGRSLNA
ncbi:MAG: hypothetical protein P8X51_10885 [Maritimibacter sp.]